MTTKKVVGTGLDDSGRSVFLYLKMECFTKKSGVVALDEVFLCMCLL